MEQTADNQQHKAGDRRSIGGSAPLASGRARRWPTVALAGGALWLLPAPAGAAFDHFLASTIVGTMTQAEARSFAAAVDKVLRKRPDGAALQWQAPQTPRHPATEAVITPLQTKQDRGQPCRQIRSELRRASNEEQWTGWFCKQIDDRWRARTVDQ